MLFFDLHFTFYISQGSSSHALRCGRCLNNEGENILILKTFVFDVSYESLHDLHGRSLIGGQSDIGCKEGIRLEEHIERYPVIADDDHEPPGIVEDAGYTYLVIPVTAGKAEDIAEGLLEGEIDLSQPLIRESRVFCMLRDEFYKIGD